MDGTRAVGRLMVRSEDVEVTVLPSIGARLHRLRVFGTDLLRTPADPTTHTSDPFNWGAYTMAPWCNRLDAGVTHVLDRTVDLQPTFPDGTAIHGQAYARPWRVVDDPFHMRGGGDGWPWPYDVTMTITPARARLDIAYRLRNLADGPMPAGIGLHPWFRPPVELTVPSTHVYRSNTDPTSRPDRVAPPLDLRTQTVPADGLDATWVNPGGPITLHWPHLGIRATLATTPSAHVAVAARPGDVDAVAVEPQTHGPGGLWRLLHGHPDAPAVLAPGEHLDLTCTLQFART